ncbi:hypothetical protein D3C87_1531940 [compost metagenome]
MSAEQILLTGKLVTSTMEANLPQIWLFIMSSVIALEERLGSLFTMVVVLVGVRLLMVVLVCCWMALKMQIENSKICFFMMSTMV